MAIGTLAAVAIGAGAIGSAAISSKASSKAAKAATQAADQSAAVQREQLQAAQGALSPYINAGQPASYALNSFLGLTPSQQTQPTPRPNALSQFAGPTYGFEGLDGPGRYYSPTEPNIFSYNSISGAPSAFGYSTPGYGAGTSMAGPVSGRDAFKTFIDNSDYAFQFQQGANALNSGYAGAGSIKSGAATKAFERYRQNLQSGYRNEFLSLLGNQQGVGLTGASALAGVGQNFANSISQINSNKADAIGNSALAKAQNIGNVFGGITSAIGYGLGR